MTPEPISITVYSRENCHLCDEAKQTIERISDDTNTDISLTEIDVDTDPALQSEYGERVPYICIDDRPAYKFRVDEADLYDRFENEGETKTD
ncbi:glutaredoxin family protein [Natronocalculus amylovorans]|uniref:Glutaredoxin family protein n=1 Tax=Natronocalculus amylovorans TaxID=2917812 RepID=A0AAE3FVT0_9EURY|nr:glutaredoxin family protein [Natronocalculus amylovorans]MCL9815883.1 glutaredoxin family protein [Natronocalculus amylovorans]NUE01605.1 glutaredoxin family protein [Halorubraceae archaeon YAN]